MSRTCVEDPAVHAGNHEHQEARQLQHGAQQRSRLGVHHVPRRQRSLNYYLLERVNNRLIIAEKT